MSYAERNRKIKQLLTKEFGCKVLVRGSRGTATGWVTVDVPKAPKTSKERDVWKAKVWELFVKNGIEIGTYGTPGDMGCDYGWGSKIHLNFLPCEYERCWGKEYRNGVEITT